MISALDISTSGLAAQRMHMNAIASNIANVSTTHNEQGEAVPYQPKFVVFQAEDVPGTHGAAGVKVSEVQTAPADPILKFEPGNPDAIKDGPNRGYVAYPNINMMEQFTDALVAARAYEANLGAMDITKNMEQQTLRILA